MYPAPNANLSGALPMGPFFPIMAEEPSGLRWIPNHETPWLNGMQESSVFDSRNSPHSYSQ